ncbi:MAG: succinate dehydrogenase assembly factor 2 [Burkholderiaceae bacterium]|jgi:antitoxin CptB|nr:succinate dehydrogenase assembly factor 2 [Burkholderiaceae bacterium]MDP4968868.1 succinate dehydrogenase assembly factor 2 [Burkholderiaceae bacterium]MDP5111597.1 succinate dehydrogenase assembly factor 2 [Burkholderiaceae bacterium]
MGTLSDQDRVKLRWRARRGLLENDLILTKYLDLHQSELTDVEVGALTQLFEIGDNELLDLLLGRVEPEGALDRPAVKMVLAQIRAA